MVQFVQKKKVTGLTDDGNLIAKSWRAAFRSFTLSIEEKVCTEKNESTFSHHFFHPALFSKKFYSTEKERCSSDMDLAVRNTYKFFLTLYRTRFI
jgi:hypothetical protein